MALDLDHTQLLDKMAQLPRSRRILVIAFSYVLVLGFFYLFFYSERTTQLVDEQDRHVLLKGQIKKAAENRKLKKESESEVERLEVKLVDALLSLPEGREIDELLRKISLHAKQSNLEMRQFKPLTEKTEKFYAEIPFAMELLGTYHQVANFFDRLSQMDRIVSVNNLQISEPDNRGGQVYLTINAEAATYRFLSDDERKKNKGQNKKGKRGGRR